MSEKLIILWECALSILGWASNIIPILPHIMSFLTLVVALFALSTWKEQKKAEVAAEVAWDLYVLCKAYTEFLRRSAKGQVHDLEFVDGQLKRVMPDGINKYAEGELAAYMAGKNELYKKCTDQINFFRMRVGGLNVERAATSLMNLEAETQLFTALLVVSKKAKTTDVLLDEKTEALKEFVEADAMKKPVEDALRKLEQAVIGYIRYDKAGKQK